MNNFVKVDVIDSEYELVHQVACFFLRKRTATFNNHIEKFAARAELCHHVKFSIIFISLVELENVWMVQSFKDVDLLMCNLIFDILSKKYLDSPLLP